MFNSLVVEVPRYLDIEHFRIILRKEEEEKKNISW